MAENNSNSHPQLKQDIRGYELGDIPAKGAFIAELQIGGPPMPLQAIVDHQYQDSQSMSRRPGFYVKYMPYRYDEINGQFHTGGSYLFDTLDNAKKYDDWSSNEFEVGDKKGSFWRQPMWAHSAHWVWNVIGAYNFAPVEEHAIGRLQRWRYEGSDAEAALKDAYPALKAAAKDQGAAAIWLLHQPEERMVAIQVAFKAKEKDHGSAKSSLTTIERQDSLGSILSKDLNLEVLFDRTSLFLSCWVPRSRELGGTEMAIPNYPLVPAITQMQS